MSRSGLGWPPPAAELAGFPALGSPARLHRLSESPTVWWYSSRTGPDAPAGGRFDLVAPHGTCYLAAGLEGALLEKTLRRPKRLVATERLRELFHATVQVVGEVALADLTAKSAAGYGINAEIHTGVDYAKPAAWAGALRAARFRGLRYLLRSDSTLRQVGVCLFGRAGLRRRAPAGMRTTVRPLDVLEATRILELRGVEVVPIPADVPVVEPGA